MLESRNCWSDFGARICKGLKKGALVLVDGEMQSREHEGKTYWSLRPNKVRRLEKREQSDQSVKPTGGGGDIDDDLPFAR